MGGPPYFKQGVLKEKSIYQPLSFLKIPFAPCICHFFFLVIYTASLEYVPESVNILEQQ